MAERSPGVDSDMNSEFNLNLGEVAQIVSDFAEGRQPPQAVENYIREVEASFTNDDRNQFRTAVNQLLAAIVVQLAQTPEEKEATFGRVQAALAASFIIPEGFKSPFAQNLRLQYERYEQSEAIEESNQREKLASFLRGLNARELVTMFLAVKKSPRLRRLLVTDPDFARALREGTFREGKKIDLKGSVEAEDLGELHKRWAPLFAKIIADRELRYYLNVAIDEATRSKTQTTLKEIREAKEGEAQGYYIPSVVIGMGVYGQVGANEMMHEAPDLIENDVLFLDGSPWIGGQFAVGTRPVFKVNNRVRPQRQGSRSRPGTEDNIMPVGTHAVVDLPATTAQTYPSQNLLGSTLKANGFLNARKIALNCQATGISKAPPGSLGEYVVTFVDKSTNQSYEIYTDVPVVASGPGQARYAFTNVYDADSRQLVAESKAAITRGDSALYYDFEDFEALAATEGNAWRDNRFNGEGILIGDGDSAIVTAAAVLGYGPDDEGTTQTSATTSLAWLGQEKLDSDMWCEGTRPRYVDLAREFPRPRKGGKRQEDAEEVFIYEERPILVPAFGAILMLEAALDRPEPSGEEIREAASAYNTAAQLAGVGTVAQSLFGASLDLGQKAARRPLRESVIRLKEALLTEESRARSEAEREFKKIENRLATLRIVREALPQIIQRPATETVAERDKVRDAVLAISRFTVSEINNLFTEDIVSRVRGGSSAVVPNLSANDARIIQGRVGEFLPEEEQRLLQAQAKIRRIEPTALSLGGEVVTYKGAPVLSQLFAFGIRLENLLDRPNATDDAILAAVRDFSAATSLGVGEDKLAKPLTPEKRSVLKRIVTARKLDFLPSELAERQRVLEVVSKLNSRVEALRGVLQAATVQGPTAQSVFLASVKNLQGKFSDPECDKLLGNATRQSSFSGTKTTFNPTEVELIVARVELALVEEEEKLEQEAAKVRPVAEGTVDEGRVDPRQKVARIKPIPFKATRAVREGEKVRVFYQDAKGKEQSAVGDWVVGCAGLESKLDDLFLNLEGRDQTSRVSENRSPLVFITNMRSLIRFESEGSQNPTLNGLVIENTQLLKESTEGSQRFYAKLKVDTPNGKEFEFEVLGRIEQGQLMEGRVVNPNPSREAVRIAQAIGIWLMRPEAGRVERLTLNGIKTRRIALDGAEGELSAQPVTVDDPDILLPVASQLALSGQPEGIFILGPANKFAITPRERAEVPALADVDQNLASMFRYVPPSERFYRDVLVPLVRRIKGQKRFEIDRQRYTSLGAQVTSTRRRAREALEVSVRAEANPPSVGQKTYTVKELRKTELPKVADPLVMVSYAMERALGLRAGVEATVLEQLEDERTVVSKRRVVPPKAVWKLQRTPEGGVEVNSMEGESRVSTELLNDTVFLGAVLAQVRLLPRGATFIELDFEQKKIQKITSPVPPEAAAA